MMLEFALKSDKNPLFIIIGYITNCLNFLFYGENFPLHDAPLSWFPVILIFPTLLTCQRPRKLSSAPGPLQFNTILLIADHVWISSNFFWQHFENDFSAL
jgi:hypothetical protein